MSQQANCPNCAATLTFKVGTSLVTVCQHCKSVVGRGDRGLETLGKVADLVQTLSPLDVGVKGRFGHIPFELVGRTQYQHPAGGVWDEWYLAFADGKWGWLAEAMGRFFLTFEVPAGGVPAFDTLQLGQEVTLDQMKLRVAEKNTAHVGGIVGEVPRRLTPGQAHSFADLSGANSTFGTLDYSGAKPSAFLGREVTLDEVGIPPGSRRTYPGLEPKVAAVRLSCPNCGGALDLRAPDQSERVGCPYCGSLLDVRQGTLELLQTLKVPKVKPVIPLGKIGQRDGVDWTCLGFLQRSVRFEGVDYFWEEYLLYHPRLGFRWLVRSDDHWTWVEAVPPGSVDGSGEWVTYAGRSYKLFQRAQARVTIVYGEFYWKVQAGEEVVALDFVAPPEGLALETTKSRDGGEMNWSHSTYVAPDEVRRMFALPDPLPSPSRIGPTQPYPYSSIYPYFAGLAGVLLLIAAIWWLFSPGKVTFQERMTFAAIPKEQTDKSQTVERQVDWVGGRNAKITLDPEGANWIGVRGVLSSDGSVPEPGGAGARSAPVRRTFSFWAAPEAKHYVYLSALPAGKYTLSLTFYRQDPDTPAATVFRIRQGVAHFSPVMVTLLILAVVPFLVGLYQMVWESQRWADSNTTGGE